MSNVITYPNCLSTHELARRLRDHADPAVRELAARALAEPDTRRGETGQLWRVSAATEPLPVVV